MRAAWRRRSGSALAVLFAAIANLRGFCRDPEGCFWELEGAALGAQLSVGMGGGLVGALFAPAIAQRVGSKRNAAILGMLWFAIFTSLMVNARLLGWAPPNGAPLTTALLLAGAAIDWVGLDPNAEASAVPASVVTSLGIVYGPCVLLPTIVPAALLWRYDIDRERRLHERARARAALRRAGRRPAYGRPDARRPRVARADGEDPLGGERRRDGSDPVAILARLREVDRQPEAIAGEPGHRDPLGARLRHSGFGGSIGFVDPRAGLSFGYVMNRQGQGTLLNPRGQSLIDETYRALGYREQGGNFVRG